MGVLEKIAQIEQEISRTQKNKATEFHLGVLKAKLARYRLQLLDTAGSKAGQKGDGFDVMKSGDARVVMIGFPSVGKSTLLNSITDTHSAAGAYEFTTLTCIAGKIQHQGSQIQLLDLPGIISGASQGKGRGRQVIAVARTADLILMVLDATKADNQKELLARELESVGMRLNARRPNVSFQVKKAGGLHVTSTCKLTHVTEKIIAAVLADYRIPNATVVIHEDITVDEFIDVVLGNRKYVRCLYCYNKIDSVSLEEVDRTARLPNTVVISCEMQLNLDYLVVRIWDMLNLVRVYTKRKGEYPDFEGGLVLRNGASVEDVCHRIHRSIGRQMRYALIWGASAKHQPQKVGLTHYVCNEDVIQIVKKA